MKKVELYYVLKGKESRGKNVKFADLGDAIDLWNALESSKQVGFMEIHVNNKQMKSMSWD